VPNSALDDASLSARKRLVELATRYHATGWMLGTSGNLSARYEGEKGPAFVITASGLDKGTLGVEDFVELNIEGELIGSGPGKRPSAETSIHQAIYATQPDAQAALHVHSVASTELGLVHGTDKALRLSELEMLKGWGFWEPGARAELPIFANHPDVPLIAKELAEWLRSPIKEDAHKAPAMLIAGHGMTAWGCNLDEAHRHVEITEFMCRVSLERLVRS